MLHERDPEAINADTKPEIGYDHRDIDVKALIWSTIWFFAGTGIVIALTYLGFWAMIDLPLRPVDPPQTVPAYPNPLLQSKEMVQMDIADLKRKEDEQLGSYGWVDKDKGVARIPIGKAIEEVAEKGLTPTPPAASPGEVRL